MDARERMLDAAEELIAERGLAALSLREVGTRAGQRNKSAVQYHFGNRLGLLTAVGDRRLGPIDAERRRRLDVVDAAGRGADLDALVDLLIRPMADAISFDTRWARFLAQAWHDTELVTGIAGRTDAWRETYARIHALLGETLPDPLPTVRVNHVVSLLFNRLADWEGGRSVAPLDVFVDDLVAVALAILTAPAAVRERDV